MVWTVPRTSRASGTTVAAAADDGGRTCGRGASAPCDVLLGDDDDDDDGARDAGGEEILSVMGAILAVPKGSCTIGGPVVRPAYGPPHAAHIPMSGGGTAA